MFEGAGRPAALRYSFAIALAVLAQLVRLPLRPPTLIPFITFVPFVLVAAAFGGLGPGLLGTLLCVANAIYFDIEPIGSFRIADPQHWIGVAVLACTGVVASLLFARLQRSEQHQRAALLELATIQACAPLLVLVVDETLQVRNASSSGVKFALRDMSDALGLGPGAAIGCLNALTNPDGCGRSPDCSGCIVRQSLLDTLRYGLPHSGVEAWVTVVGGDGAAPRCLEISTVPVQFDRAAGALCCLPTTSPAARVPKKKFAL